MRYKVAPPARPVSFLRTARGALSPLPDPEADCCRAIRTACDLDDRETARGYLVFMQALGLVAESERGYHRTQAEFEAVDLADGFRRRVFLADAVLDALDAEPRDVDALFAAVADEVPPWERQRHADWAATWRERVRRLAEWAVELELGTSTPDGYTAR